MPLPVQTKRILDSKGRFHPTAKWETYQTFPPDSIGFLLDILYCNLPMKDTIWTIDKSGNQTLPIEYKKYRTGMCFSPGLGILIWSKGKIIEFYAVCFYCSNIAKGTDTDYLYNYEDCIYIKELEMEMKRLGY